jgi:hypothetical protein
MEVIKVLHVKKTLVKNVKYIDLLLNDTFYNFNFELNFKNLLLSVFIFILKNIYNYIIIINFHLYLNNK